MPGQSYTGPLPPLTDAERVLSDDLRRHVSVLADEIGERNVFLSAKLDRSAAYLEEVLRGVGFEAGSQWFEVGKHSVRNLEAELPGGEKKNEIVIVGAHYDSVVGTPGANDNGSGVAAMLELARLLKDSRPARTIRFVAFVNEEPPFFQTRDMGSFHYARRCRKRDENVVAMLSLETIGYYSDEPGSQKYPPLFSFFYPNRGDFIAFVGNVGSRKLVRRAVESFRKHARFPSEGAAPPGVVPGVGWSDHWSFWRQGFPALMVTDTAPFRYPHYHLETDTLDKIDFERLARVVAGLERVVRDLAGATQPPEE
ncbi:MAG TPA: M28 family peptidase [Sumerlaeia bacterium]|nr:M28 family peptidase [Sumerlaeia bacterium]